MFISRGNYRLTRQFCIVVLSSTQNFKKYRKYKTVDIDLILILELK